MGVDLSTIREAVKSRGGRQVKRRRSPENRKPSEPKIVFDIPYRLPEEWEQYIEAIDTVKLVPTGHSAERVSPLLRATVDGVPLDRHWYFAVIAFSRGEAGAFVNPIKYGAVGHDLEVVYFRIPNKNTARPRKGGEWAICIRRTP